MSFDIFPITFGNGADAAAARTVLDRVRYDLRPGCNSYDLNFEDGSHAELYAGGLHGGDEQFDGGSFALRGLSDAIGAFIFEFARAAGCVIIPAMKPACVLLTRDDLAGHLPAHLRDDFQQIPIASGAELLVALEGGHDAWQAYRDHVLRTSGGGPPSGGVAE